MNFLLSIIPTVLVLGILIIVHEFGHFLACRLAGVTVEKFSIGFGPEIFHWQGKKTRYVVSLFPLGGFVKPAGESVSEVEATGIRPGDYLAASLPARIFIVAAGVLMNYLVAFFLFVGIYMAGSPVPGTKVGGFIKGYPAEAAGLLVGDRIAQVNGQEVKTWKELTDAFTASPEGPMELLVKRPSAPSATTAALTTASRPSESGTEEELSLHIAPRVEEIKNAFGEPVRVKRLGIMPHPEADEFERYGFFGAVEHAWKTEVFLTVMTHKAIFYLVLGKLSMKAISGPIGIISVTGNAAQLGLPYLLQLAATLSVSLAVINLLPIPALDGGHLMFLLIEGIRRRQVSLKVQERATQIGFALLMTLMVAILYNDLVNIDAFEKIRGLFQQ